MYVNYKERSMKVPFVVLMDLDHSIIGSTGPQWAQVCVHEASQKLQAVGVIPPTHHIPDVDLEPAMRAGVLRPGLKTFIQGLHRLYKQVGVEFFVYTNAHEAWAHKKVAAVEHVSGVRFRRPVFCGDVYTLEGVLPGVGKVARVKALHLVLPHIVRSLARTQKYSALLGHETKAQEMLLKDHILFIDDTPGNLVDAETAVQLVVPAYMATFNDAPDAQLPLPVRHHPRIKALVKAKQAGLDSKKHENMSELKFTQNNDNMWQQLLEVAKIVAPALPTAGILRHKFMTHL